MVIEIGILRGHFQPADRAGEGRFFLPFFRDGIRVGFTHEDALHDLELTAAFRAVDCIDFCHFTDWFLVRYRYCPDSDAR